MIAPAKNLLARIQGKRGVSPGQDSLRTIAVCAAQIPFFKGGAEAHAGGLVRELAKRQFEAELISIPYKWYPHDRLLKSIEVWRMIDLTESNGKKIDMIITTKFPTYFAEHPRKVLWLFHQYRQLYDLFDSPYSDFDISRAEHRKLRDRLVAMDTQVLKTYKRIYANSKNTAARLKKYNGIEATPLYHPPQLAGRYYNGENRGYILSVGRLDRLKRVDLLVKCLAHADRHLQCKIAGTGPEAEALMELARQEGVADRIEFLGYVSDDQLLDLYAHCAFVFFAPLDEDYGYISLEAFLSQKPVLTSFDSGGPLEFVEDGRNGMVVHSLDVKELARKSEELFFDTPKSREFGKAGYEKVKDISWDFAIETLLNG
jgi:glycosyltransferase involved in cell wall biosynthesis